MVAQEDPPLAAVGDLRGLGEDLGDRVALLPPHRHEHARHEREVEAHVALVAVGPEVVDDVLGPLVGLRQQHPAGVLVVDDLADAAQVLVGLREVLAVGAVALEQVRHGVEPEAVEAEVEPEADDVEHGVGHLGVVVVEVGLVVEEAVPEVLAALLVEGPVRRLGVDEDHPRLAPALVVVAPHVPVGLRVGGVLPALLEPRVLVGGVVHHQVGDDPHAALVRLLEEQHRVADVAVLREHGEEVGDVVAAVAQGRVVEGQQPDAVDAEPLQVVEPLGEAPQVAGAVAVAVVEARARAPRRTRRAGTSARRPGRSGGSPPSRLAQPSD